MKPRELTEAEEIALIPGLTKELLLKLRRERPRFFEIGFRMYDTESVLKRFARFEQTTKG